MNNKQSEIERLTEEVLNATSKPAKEVTIKRGNRFCSICSFESDFDLQKHIEEYHTHTCEKCEDVLFNNDHLESHIRIYHIWDCDFCDFTTDTEEIFLDHNAS